MNLVNSFFHELELAEPGAEEPRSLVEDLRHVQIIIAASLDDRAGAGDALDLEAELAIERDRREVGRHDAQLEAMTADAPGPALESLHQAQADALTAILRAHANADVDRAAARRMRAADSGHHAY